MTDTKAGSLVVTEHRHGGEGEEHSHELKIHNIWSFSKCLSYQTRNDVISDLFFFFFFLLMIQHVLLPDLSRNTCVYTQVGGGFVLCFNSVMTHVWKERTRVCGWIIRLRPRRESGLEKNMKKDKKNANWTRYWDSSSLRLCVCAKRVNVSGSTFG